MAVIISPGKQKLLDAVRELYDYCDNLDFKLKENESTCRAFMEMVVHKTKHHVNKYALDVATVPKPKTGLEELFWEEDSAAMIKADYWEKKRHGKLK